MSVNSQTGVGLKVFPYLMGFLLSQDPLQQQVLHIPSAINNTMNKYIGYYNFINYLIYYNIIPLLHPCSDLSNSDRRIGYSVLDISYPLQYTFDRCAIISKQNQNKFPGWRNTMVQRTAYLIGAFIILCSMASHSFSEVIMKKEQTVYVSAYPHVFMGPKGNIFDLAITLLIRNTDLKSQISVTSIDYYDTKGTLTRKYLNAPLTILPMASSHIIITEKDTSGGIGSNFIVRWKSDREVNAPVIEAVMIGGKSGQGISFVSEGREIRE
jgi:hypothetical protein